MKNKNSNAETNFTHNRRKKASMWYYNFAEKHYKSSQILCDSKEGHIDEIIKLLWGLSIELTLKGIICTKTQQAPKFTHKLVELARMAEVPLSENEKQLCLMLTGYIEFAGKYPTGKDDQTMNAFNTLITKNHFEFSGEGLFKVKTPKKRGKNILNRENYEALYDRLVFIFFNLNGYGLP